MKKVNEIFYSIQGEGYFTGTPAIFIRFSGCNLKCPFCDTQHQSGQMMTDDQILAEVWKYPSKVVILTGGEPGLQIDDALLIGLSKMCKYVCIETNGTVKLPEAGIDWITCSPKEGGETILSDIDELKVVYTGQDMAQYDRFNAMEYYLQPCSCQNTEEVINYIKDHPKWKLSLQTQKILNVR